MQALWGRVWHKNTTEQPPCQKSQEATHVIGLDRIIALTHFLCSGAEEALKSHVKKDETNNLYFCDICRQFSNRGAANVRNHVEAKHFPNMFTYTCELCDMTFGKKTALYNHRKNTHRKPEMMNVSTAFPWK